MFCICTMYIAYNLYNLRLCYIHVPTYVQCTFPNVYNLWLCCMHIYLRTMYISQCVQCVIMFYAHMYNVQCTYIAQCVQCVIFLHQFMLDKSPLKSFKCVCQTSGPETSKSNLINQTTLNYKGLIVQSKTPTNLSVILCYCLYYQRQTL